jgi:hypothetical protein
VAAETCSSSHNEHAIFIVLVSSLMGVECLYVARHLSVNACLCLARSSEMNLASKHRKLVRF